MESEEHSANLVLQLESIYSTLHYNGKDDNSTLNSPSFDELDYGEKLIANHNILKDLILVVDNKIAGKLAKKSKLLQQKEESQISSNVQLLSLNEKKRSELYHNKETNQNRLQEKMFVVREKLKEIIQYINSEAKSDRKAINQDSKLQQIKEISSQSDPSLQYSRDPSELLENSKDKIIIDKSKLQNAKEVVSHEFLHPEKNQLSNRSYFEQNNYMKSSLERISEVQSGQNVTEKDTELGYASKGHSRMSSKEATAKNSLQLIQQQRQLDETGKIILSTINKKTTSTRTLQRQKSDPLPPLNSSVINEATSSQEGDSIAGDIKKNRFWLKNLNNPIQQYSKNTLVSHESLQDSKVFEKITKNNIKITTLNSFKGDDKALPSRKSIEKLPLSNNQRSPPKPNPVNNSAIQIQSSQMIPLNNNTYLFQKSQSPNKSSLIYQKGPVGQPMVAMRLQRQPSMPNVRQSRIIKEYQQQPYIVQRPISIKRQAQNIKGQLISNHVNYNPQQRFQRISYQSEFNRPPLYVNNSRQLQMKYPSKRAQSPPPKPHSPNNIIEIRKQHSQLINNQGRPIIYHQDIYPFPSGLPINTYDPNQVMITNPNSLNSAKGQTPYGQKQSVRYLPHPQSTTIPPKPSRPPLPQQSQTNQKVIHRYKPSLQQIIETSERSFANSAHKQSINHSRVTAIQNNKNMNLGLSRASRSGSKRKGIQLTTAFPAC